MNTQKLHRVVMLVVFLLAGFCTQAQNYQGLFSDKPKKLLVEAKVGRSFLGNSEVVAADEAQVFYGGAALTYGMMLHNTLLGIGAGAEYVDMMQGSFDFPLFANVQHYFSGVAGSGFFVGAKLGYILGGKKTMPIQTVVMQETIDGSIDRSMQGFYGEVSVGYRWSSINFFVAYNYRVISYKTVWVPNSYGVSNSTSSRVMHTAMLGVSFMLF